MRNLNSGRKGKIPQWGPAGGLYLSPSEYQTGSSPSTFHRRGVPFPGLLRGICVLERGAVRTFLHGIA